MELAGSGFPDRAVEGLGEVQPLGPAQIPGYPKFAIREAKPEVILLARVADQGDASEGGRRGPDHPGPLGGLQQHPDFGGGHLDPLVAGSGAVAGSEGDDHRQQIKAQENRHRTSANHQKDAGGGGVDRRQDTDQDHEAPLRERSMRGDHRVHEKGAVHPEGKICRSRRLGEMPRAGHGQPMPAKTPTPRERQRLHVIFERFEAAMPDPRTELTYQSPFALLVAVVLSAQATDVSVNKATPALFASAGAPQTMLALGEAGVARFISSIGLYNAKARNVVALSRILIEQHGGEVPLNRQALQALPGVGRKTASVVLNELGVEPAIAVDTHVFRVAHRLGLSAAKTPDLVEADLMRITPKTGLTRAHHWLILHGRYTCVARKPKCGSCLVSDLCPSRELFEGA